MTVTAVAAGDMAFTADPLANMEAGNAFTQGSNLAHIFVADGLTGFDMLGCPIVPLIDMDIGATDGGFVNFDQDFTGAGFRDGNLGQNETRTGMRLYKRIHHFLRHGVHSLK